MPIDYSTMVMPERSTSIFGYMPYGNNTSPAVTDAVNQVIDEGDIFLKIAICNRVKIDYSLTLTDTYNPNGDTTVVTRSQTGEWFYRNPNWGQENDGELNNYRAYFTGLNANTPDYFNGLFYSGFLKKHLFQNYKTYSSLAYNGVISFEGYNGFESITVYADAIKATTGGLSGLIPKVLLKRDDYLSEFIGTWEVNDQRELISNIIQSIVYGNTTRTVTRTLRFYEPEFHIGPPGTELMTLGFAE